MKTIFFLFSFAILEITNAQTWQWAKSAGGFANDKGYSIATDPSGNVLVTGYFDSPTITFGTATLTNAGMFLVKYDPSGNVLWAKNAGAYSVGNSVSTDANGNVLVTGSFYSPTITFGNTILTNAGGDDIFLVKYDALGNVLWAKSAGGTSVDKGQSVSTDANGNVLVTGNFDGPSITFGSITLTNSVGYGIFLVKYDPSGNVLWAINSQSAGTSPYVNFGWSVCTDAGRNVLITGEFNSSAITFGTTTLTNFNLGGGAATMFLVKYDESGNMLWAQRAGGAGYDSGKSVSTDANGNLLVTGFFRSPTITFGTTTTLTNANITVNTADIFLVKYAPSGSVLYAQRAGGASADDGGYSVAADPNGNVLVTGYFSSPTITFGTITLTNASASSNDIFLVKYDASGNVLWAKSTGGTPDDYGMSVATDANGNVLLTGYFRSGTLAFGNTTLTNTFSGINDFFVAKLSDVTGMQEWLKNSELEVFPNPCRGMITVQSSKEIYKIDITNILGEEIYSSFVNSDKIEIDLNKEPNGIYFLQITTDPSIGSGGIERKKIVVSR